MTGVVDKADERDTMERIRMPKVPDWVYENCEEHPVKFSGMSGGPWWRVQVDGDEEEDGEIRNWELWGITFLKSGRGANDGLEFNCYGPVSIERITSVKEGTWEGRTQEGARRRWAT